MGELNNGQRITSSTDSFKKSYLFLLVTNLYLDYLDNGECNPYMINSLCLHS